MLTQREIEFCHAFLGSKGCKQWKEFIEDILGIKRTTIKKHLANIFKKLDIETQSELMFFLLTDENWQYTSWDKTSIKNGLR